MGEFESSTTTGSITDFTFVLKQNASKEEINQAFREAIENPIYKGILAISMEICIK
jgi:glyceraldehyde-3-phosphate dehydrogenase/erythrose-4-phosphate dehydrogenase